MDPDALPGFGHGPFTRQKYDDFAEFFGLHTRICRHIFDRWPDRGYPYLYLELNAGPGLWCPPDARDVLVTGTPLLACRRLHELAAGGRFPYVAHLLEQEPATYSFLREAVESGSELDLLDADRVVVSQGDHEVLAPAVLNQWGSWLARGDFTRVYGLIFHDPTGLPNFALLRRLVRHRAAQHLDLLIYLQATALKRNLNRPADPDRGAPLAARLTRIDKRYWLVREPDGQHQFSFLLGTNWADFPAWKRLRFHRVDQPEGRDLLERLSFEREEYQQRRAARTNTLLQALVLAQADAERWGQPIDPLHADEGDEGDEGDNDD